MNYYDISCIDIPFLQDALTLCDMQGYKFCSLYMDKKGECSITFEGKLDMCQVQMILFQLYLDDVTLADINPEYLKDYEYFDTQEAKPCTRVFTPDGINYKTMTTHNQDNQ